MGARTLGTAVVYESESQEKVETAPLGGLTADVPTDGFPAVSRQVMRIA